MSQPSFDAPPGGPYGPPVVPPPAYGPPPAYAPPTAYGPPAYGPPAYGPPTGQYTPQPVEFTACRLCGSVPAVSTTFRGHRGFIVFMQFLSTEGPFCRDCGLGIFRHMTSRTLVQGWYGYGSAIITPITVIINLFRRNKVAKLGPPQSNPYGPSRPPMDPGPRLLQRPMTWVGLLIPFAVIFVLILAAGSSGS